MFKICDVEKYIDAYDEKELLKQEGENLRKFYIDMNDKFHNNLDEIHKAFLEKYFMEYDSTNDREVCLIREIFKFIKDIK